MDPATLAITGEIDYWRDYSAIAKLADWGIRMHMGFLFGWLNQLVLLGVAVALATVVIALDTGCGGSVVRPGDRPGRSGEYRGAAGCATCIRPRIAAIAVVAVAVGWFLPLLGISLIGFLVVDAVIGGVKARRASPDLSAAGPTLAMPGKAPANSRLSRAE